MTGRRVMITRPMEHTERLAAMLRMLDIEPVAVPAISYEPPATYGPLDDAIQNLNQYQWVLFSSRTGVRVFFERVAAGGRVLPPHLRWAAVGPGTAEALHAQGAEHVWVPSRHLSATLGDELPAQPGDRMLRIRPEAAPALLATRLRARGVEVNEIVAYRTAEGPLESVALLRNALAGGVDAVIFTSASTVRGFARLIQYAGLSDEMASLTLIAIGPVTADAIRALGWAVHLVADEHSVDGISELMRRRHGDAAGIPRS